MLLLQEPVTPISAMKAALRPSSGKLARPSPIERNLDSGSLSQPLLYGKSADGSLSEAGDQPLQPKLPVVPELAEAFAILAWWLRIQVPSAVTHPSWSEALSNIAGCILAAFTPQADQEHASTSPSGAADAAPASQHKQLHKQAVHALCHESSTLQLHVVHFLARILDVQPAAVQTLRPLGVWEILCGPAFFLHGGSSPPAAGPPSSETSGKGGSEAGPAQNEHVTGPADSTASDLDRTTVQQLGRGDASPDGRAGSAPAHERETTERPPGNKAEAAAGSGSKPGLTVQGRGEDQQAWQGTTAPADDPGPSPAVHTLRGAVIALLEKVACMRGLDNTDVEITKVHIRPGPTSCPPDA